MNNKIDQKYSLSLSLSLSLSPFFAASAEDILSRVLALRMVSEETLAVFLNAIAFVMLLLESVILIAVAILIAPQNRCLLSTVIMIVKQTLGPSHDLNHN